MIRINIILILTVTIASVSCTNHPEYPYNSSKTGRIIHTTNGVVNISNDALDYTYEKHIELSHRAYASGKLSIAEVHAKLALKKNNYSKDARTILENINDHDASYYRKAYKYTRIGRAK